MKLLHSFALLFSVQTSLAQSIYFEKDFGTDNDDWARDVLELSDGTMYVAGYSNGGPWDGTDVCLVKLNKFGNILWTKYYGDTLNNYCFSMVLTHDNQLVLAGETQTPLAQTDGFLMKVDTSGNEIWTQYYSSPVNESVYTVALLDDGGFAMVGFINDTSGYNNAWMLRADSLGNEIWQKSHGGTDNDYAMGLKITPQGHLLISADTRSVGAGGYDIELIKMDTAGNILWNTLHGDSLQNGCQGVCITSDNQYIVLGETENFQFSPYNFFTVKCDTAGNEHWKKKTGGIHADAAFAMVEAPNGDYVFTGYSASYSAGNTNLILVRADTAANINWTKTFGGPGVDIGYKIIKSVLGGYIMTGTYTDSILGTINQYLIHVDENGEFLSMHETEENGITVFPNPTNNYICITGLTESVVVTIVDVMGRETANVGLMPGQCLDVSQYPNGYYSLHVVEKKNVYSTRFIKY